MSPIPEGYDGTTSKEQNVYNAADGVSAAIADFIASLLTLDPMVLIGQLLGGLLGGSEEGGNPLIAALVKTEGFAARLAQALIAGGENGEASPFVTQLIGALISGDEEGGSSLIGTLVASPNFTVQLVGALMSGGGEDEAGGVSPFISLVVDSMRPAIDAAITEIGSQKLSVLADIRLEQMNVLLAIQREKTAVLIDIELAKSAAIAAVQGAVTGQDNQQGNADNPNFQKEERIQF